MKSYEVRATRPTGAVMLFGLSVPRKEDPLLLAMLRLGVLGFGARIEVEPVSPVRIRRRERRESRMGGDGQ